MENTNQTIENLQARIKDLQDTIKQMQEKKKYNGWNNYETWCVKLWLDNDEYNQSRQRLWLSNAKESAIKEDEENHSDYLTIEDHTKRILADILKDCIELENPLADDASMFSDLMNSAIAEVDFFEIAENIMNEH